MVSTFLHSHKGEMLWSHKQLRGKRCELRWSRLDEELTGSATETLCRYAAWITVVGVLLGGCHFPRQVRWQGKHTWFPKSWSVLFASVRASYKSERTRRLCAFRIHRQRTYRVRSRALLVNGELPRHPSYQPTESFMVRNVSHLLLWTCSIQLLTTSGTWHISLGDASFWYHRFC